MGLFSGLRPRTGASLERGVDTGALIMVRHGHEEALLKFLSHFGFTSLGGLLVPRTGTGIGGDLVTSYNDS